jgi:hypothetical protein
MDLSLLNNDPVNLMDLPTEDNITNHLLTAVDPPQPINDSNDMIIDDDSLCLESPPNMPLIEETEFSSSERTPVGRVWVNFQEEEAIVSKGTSDSLVLMDIQDDDDETELIGIGLHRRRCFLYRIKGVTLLVLQYLVTVLAFSSQVSASSITGPHLTFNGQTVGVSSSLTSQTAMIPPEPDGDDTIFISIASYRGTYLGCVL